MCLLPKTRFSKKGRTLYLTTLALLIIPWLTFFTPLVLWVTMKYEDFCPEQLDEIGSFIQEWKEKPFVDIQITNNCTDGETLFNRYYNLSIVEGFNDEEQTISLSTPDGKVLCAKRGSTDYLGAVRVDPNTLECPSGFKSCAAGMSPENQICYTSDESIDQCPITFIDFIPVGTDVDAGDVVLPWSDELSLVYSKTFDSLPIYDARVEFEVPYLVTKDYDLANCQAHGWCRKIGEYSLSEYEFLLFSGLTYRNAISVSKQSVVRGQQLNFYTRRFASWALKCEEETEPSIRKALENVAAQEQHRIKQVNEQRRTNLMLTRTDKPNQPQYRLIPWSGLQIGFDTGVLFFIFLSFSIGCYFETKDFTDKEKEDIITGSLFALPFVAIAATIFNILAFFQMRKVLNTDKEGVEFVDLARVSECMEYPSEFFDADQVMNDFARTSIQTNGKWYLIILSLHILLIVPIIVLHRFAVKEQQRIAENPQILDEERQADEAKHPRNAIANGNDPEQPQE